MNSRMSRETSIEIIKFRISTWNALRAFGFSREMFWLVREIFLQTSISTFDGGTIIARAREPHEALANSWFARPRDQVSWLRTRCCYARSSRDLPHSRHHCTWILIHKSTARMWFYKWYNKHAKYNILMQLDATEKIYQDMSLRITSSILQEYIVLRSSVTKTISW